MCALVKKKAMQLDSNPQQHKWMTPKWKDHRNPWVVRKWGYDPRLQVSRQMSRVSLKWVGRCYLSWKCLSNSTLECESPAKSFPPKTVNEKRFLSTQSLTFILSESQWTLLKLTSTIQKLNSTSTTKTKKKQASILTD